MRIVVTGAAGFIGSEVTRALVAAGHEVTALVRAVDRVPRLDSVRARARLEALDLEDLPRVDRLLAEGRPDAVFHLAWYAGPGDYLTSKENLRSLSMTAVFFERVAAHGCRKLIGAGTCLEYARLDRPRVEEDRCEPESLYASSKVAAWLVGRALAGPMELAWGRIFHLHGPAEDPARLLPWIAGELRRGAAVDLSDGTQIRDHLHVEDVASGLVALLQPGAVGPFNVCSGEPVTLRRVVEIVGRALGRESLLRFGARPHQPGEVMFLAGDPGRLRALGWRPRHSLDEGLADSVVRQGRAGDPG